MLCIRSHFLPIHPNIMFLIHIRIGRCGIIVMIRIFLFMLSSNVCPKTYGIWSTTWWAFGLKSIEKYFGFHPERYFPVTWSTGTVSLFDNGSLILGGPEPWGVIFGVFWPSDACKRCCILSLNIRRGSWPGKDGQLQLSLIFSACKQRKGVLWYKQKNH